VPFGKESALKLATCHSELRRLIEKAMAGIDEGDLAYAGIKDMTVVCGYRGKAAQEKAVREGHSKKPWPSSAHNHVPSNAVDVAPYPIDWNDVRSFEVLHAYIAGVAQALGIDLHDISWDRPHIERKA
jgi:peptidoglycan L-alanyl-D-glutamate endopeptidase CwlK